MPDATVAPSNITVMPVSLAANPEPLTVIEPPGVPLPRLTTIPPETVKLAWPTLLAEVVLPEAPTLWGPDADDGNVKVVLHPP